MTALMYHDVVPHGLEDSSGFPGRDSARYKVTPAQFEAYNANYIGGDISGGAPILPQLFLRPTASFYRTPVRGLYLCSSSTPPGGGVHGMCGYFAAEAALKADRSK